MSNIELHIDTLALSGFDGDTDAVRSELERALSILATRLAKSPFGRMPAKQIALQELELGTLSAKELGAPGAAERLADALYTSLERSLA